MDFKDIAARGMVILGCGKMGSAMLAGWLARGLPPTAVWVLDPAPSDWVRGTGVHVNAGAPAAPAVAIIAVKPQMMGAALPTMAAMGNGSTLFLTVAAGTPIATYEAVLGAQTPVIRAMPNTPAAVGRGISAIIDHRGQVLGRVPAFERGLFSAEIQPRALHARMAVDIRALGRCRGGPRHGGVARIERRRIGEQAEVAVGGVDEARAAACDVV